MPWNWACFEFLRSPPRRSSPWRQSFLARWPTDFQLAWKPRSGRSAAGGSAIFFGKVKSWIGPARVPHDRPRTQLACVLIAVDRGRGTSICLSPSTGTNTCATAEFFGAETMPCSTPQLSPVQEAAFLVSISALVPDPDTYAAKFFAPRLSTSPLSDLRLSFESAAWTGDRLRLPGSNCPRFGLALIARSTIGAHTNLDCLQALDLPRSGPTLTADPTPRCLRVEADRRALRAVYTNSPTRPAG